MVYAIIHLGLALAMDWLGKKECVLSKSINKMEFNVKLGKLSAITMKKYAFSSQFRRFTILKMYGKYKTYQDKIYLEQKKSETAHKRQDKDAKENRVAWVCALCNE